MSWSRHRCRSRCGYSYWIRLLSLQNTWNTNVSTESFLFRTTSWLNIEFRQRLSDVRTVSYSCLSSLIACSFFDNSHELSIYQKWNSVCKESYVWTYAKVMTFEGEVGWSWIPIRGSCGCAIWPIDTPETTTTNSRGRRISSSKSSLSSTSSEKMSTKTSGATSRTLVNRNVERDPFL